MPIVPPCRHDLDHARIDWRAVDATTEAQIEHHTASDADTAPLFSANALLAAARHIEPDAIEDEPCTAHVSKRPSDRRRCEPARWPRSLIPRPP